MVHRLNVPLLSITPVLAAMFALSGCGDDQGGGGAATATSSTSATTGSGAGGAGGGGGDAAVPVALRFEGRVGDRVFACAETYAGLGTAATDVQLSDFRFYIHDVRLRRVDGTEAAVALDQDGMWQVENVALLDFEDKSGPCANGTAETHAEVRGTAPDGAYTGLAFKLGVPFELNHSDAASAPSPLNLSGLFWSWNGGRKFLRIDAASVAGGAPFNVHVGSTGCLAAPDGGVASCARPNVAEVELTGFDPLATKVIVDYAALVAGSDMTVNGGGPPGCQSGETDPECPPIFARLGIDAADGSTHPEQQELFRAE